MKAIEVVGLSKAYGSRVVLEEVSFTVGHGETVALLGPNGAGKTTTVEVLEGFRVRDGGQVQVLGEDPARFSRQHRSQVGVVLQETTHDPHLSTGETVELVAGWYDNPLPIGEALDLVSLGDAAQTRVSKLSGGQRRRLDLALGLIGRPRLLFLDEPTTGFDPEARREAWQVLRRLRDQETTVVLTTHYLDEAAYLADRIVVLSRGRIVAEGPPSSIGGRDTCHQVSFRPRSQDRLPAGGEVTDGRWSAVTPDVTGVVRSLSDWSRETGYELDDLCVERPSLEDIYLELIA